MISKREFFTSNLFPLFLSSTSKLVFDQNVILRQSLILSFVGLGLFLSQSFAQLSGSFTINQDSATSTTNFHSIQEAADSLNKLGVSGPVVLNIVSGTGPYVEQVDIRPIPGASAINTITFNGSGDTIRYNTSSTSDKHIIFLDSADYIRIKNFVFEGRWGGMGIRLDGYADHNIIRNNIFDYRATWGFQVLSVAVAATGCPSSVGSVCYSSASYNIVRQNKVYGATGARFVGGSGSTGQIGNIIDSNIIEDFYEYGIYVQGNKNCNIYDNDISRPHRTSGGTFRGIHVTFLSPSNNRVYRNRVHNSHGNFLNKNGDAYGITFHEPGQSNLNPNKIYNNLIYDFETKGDVFGIYCYMTGYVESSFNTVAFHDTISKEGSATAYRYTGWGTFGYGSGFKLYSNLFYVHKDGSDSKWLIYQENGFLTSNYNNLYIAGSGSGVKYYGRRKNYSSTTFSGWQTLYTWDHDTNSVSSNPLFRDLSSWDLMPNDTISEGKGWLYMALMNTDFFNVSRKNPPDPGAIEFDPVHNDAGLPRMIEEEPTCFGKQALRIILLNAGIDTLKSVSIKYSINNGPVDSADFNVNLAIQEEDTLTIDSITIASPISVKFWIVNINGGADAFAGNDTLLSPIIKPPMSGYYTINKSLAASGNNYHSFKEVINDLTIGGICGPVTIDVKTAFYNEIIRVGEIRGSSKTNTVTFKGNNATLTYTTNSINNSMIELIGTDYFVFDNFNFVISSASSQGWGARLANYAEHNIIENCDFNIKGTTAISFYYGGVVATGDPTDRTVLTHANYNTIRNNIFRGGEFGIRINGDYLDNSKGNIIKGNTIKDVPYGIYLEYVDSTLIDSNNLTNETCINCRGYYGIQLRLNCKNNVISNNRIHHTNGQAVYPQGNIAVTRPISMWAVSAPSGSENHIYNNAIYKLNSNWSNTVGIYLASPTGLRVNHNTLVLDHSPLNAGYQVGIEQRSSPTSNVEITNNLIYMANGSGGVQRGLNIQNTVSVCDYNNIYLDTNSMTGLHMYAAYQFSYYTTLNDWQTVNSGAFGQNSEEKEPIFRDPATFNYIPTNDTLIDMCARIARIDKDIRGHGRDTLLTDPGAYLIAYFDDAGIGNFVDSSFACQGNLPLKVNLVNYGSDTLYNVKVHWKFHYSPPIEKDTSLIGINLSPGDTMTLLLDTVYLAGGVVIDSWTSLPNGKIDERDSNDLSAQYFNTRMSGYYTINRLASASDTNYTSFTTFATDINARGLCGPVVAEVVANTGTYQEQFELRNIFGNNSVNTITLLGNNNIITENPTDSKPFIVKLNGVNHVTIDSLQMIAGNNSTACYTNLINGESNNIQIQNCYIQSKAESNLKFAGIAIYDSLGSFGVRHNITVENCEIKGGRSGIMINNNGSMKDSTLIISKNEIHDFYTVGISANNTTNMEFVSNNIHRNSLANVGNFTGIELKKSSGPGIVSKNEIHHSHEGSGPSTLSKAAKGIYLDSCNSVGSNTIAIANNLIHHLNNTGYATGIEFNSSNRINLFYNTISLDAFVTSLDEVTGIKVDGFTSNSDIRNNIISIERGSSDNVFGIDLNGSSYPSCDYNSVYTNIYGSGSAYFGKINTTNHPTLKDWQASSSGSFGANSKMESPNFDYLSNDFVPSNVSINDMADPIASIPNDYRDSVRAVNPDPGAFEFDPLTHDVQTYGLIMSQISTCGDSNQIINMIVKNNGLADEDSVILFVGIRVGSNFDTLNYVIDTLKSGQTDTISMGMIDAFTGGLYKFLSVIFKSNDMNHSNDSVSQSVLIHASPTKPKISDTAVCINKPSKLSLKSVSWLYRWYLSDTSSNHFNQGLHYNLHPITDDTSFYIQSVSLLSSCVSPKLEYKIGVDSTYGGFSYSFSSNNEVMFTNLSGGFTTAYEWDFDDGNTSIDTNPSHTFAQNGIYLVSLTTFGDCDTIVTTDSVELKYVGVENLDESRVRIDPNPSKGIFRLKLVDYQNEDIEIVIADITGRICYNESFKNGASKLHYRTIDLTSFKKGSYVFLLKNKGNTERRILIIY